MSQFFLAGSSDAEIPSITSPALAAEKVDSGAQKYRIHPEPGC
ncbi:hypothetical protein [Mesorhizobium sp. M0323]